MFTLFRPGFFGPLQPGGPPPLNLENVNALTARIACLKTCPFRSTSCMNFEKHAFQNKVANSLGQ